MKTILVTFPVLLLATFSFSQSQSYKVTWGDEVKLKKSTTDMDIVAADNSGVYFTEGQLKMKNYFVIGASFTTAYKLIKFDKNFNELYEKEYKKELKGYTFRGFQMLDENLYMFATDYDRKEKLFKVFGVKIDKSSGDFIGDLSELGSYELENKRDNYDVKLDTFNNGKNFLIVTDISNDDRNSIAVSVLDDKLQKKESAVINTTYEKDTYTVQDVKYVNGKIAVLGKEYEKIVKNGKTRKKLVFKQFALSVYNNKGKKEKDIDLGVDNRFVIGGQMIVQPTGELLLAGFYSDQQKKENLNGFFLNKVDLVKGALTLSSYKEINASMLGTAVKDDGDEDEDDKKQKKNAKKEEEEDDDDDELPNNFIIRTIDVNPADMAYIITAEVSQYKTRTYTRAQSIGGHTTWTTYTVRQFINKDILVIDADKSAQIKWINILPKYQLEEITTSGSGFYYDFGGFLQGVEQCLIIHLTSALLRITN